MLNATGVAVTVAFVAGMLTVVVSKAGTAGAATTGQQVGQVTFSQACSSGVGVGITYDGSSLWYSCHGQSPDLFRANPSTGQVTGSWTIDGGLGALAYDAGRNALWAGWSGPNQGNIWLINLDSSHSVVSSSVAFSTCAQSCSPAIDDGLAYDAGDDSLYFSPDTSTTVYHYSSSGSFLGSFPWAGNSCYNSGLGLGGGDLYEGSDGCNEVWVVSKANPSTVLFSFATGGVRDEALTCDPNTFGSLGDTVMWSKEAYTAIAYAFDIPSGSCGAGGTSSGPPVGGSLGSTEQTSGNPGENSGSQCPQGNNPVNCATGDFYHSFTDLAIPGRGDPIDLTRTYNSLEASTNGPFGYGWVSTYTMNLSTDASGNVTVHQEDGSTLVFNPNGSGGYTALPRVLATLVKNSDGSYTLTRRQRDIFTFSAAGALTSAKDLNGYTTSLAHNGSGQLATVTDPSGRAITFTYGSNGDISAVTDPAGRKVSYSYDANGNLAAVTDVAGNKWSFTYDTNHLLTSMTDPRGGIVTNVYDTSARVLSQTDQLGHKTSFAYSGSNLSPGGGTTTVTVPNGNVTVENYAYGELTSVTKGSGTPQAATSSYTYDANTLGMTSATDPDGHTTLRSYDANGNLTTILDALHRKTLFTYDSLDDTTSVTDPAGTTTSYTFDASGNQTGASRSLTGTTQVQQITYIYGDSSHPGDVTSMTDPDGKVWSYTYDSYGNKISGTDPLGNKGTYTYDIVGRSLTQVAPKGNVSGGNPSAFTTSYSTDAYGEVTKVTDPLGHVATTTYDPNRNTASTVDQNGNITTYTYDAANEPTKVSRANGTSLSYAYDGDGNQTGQTDGKGNATSYGYDPLNRVTSVTDPLGRKTSFTYDGVGNKLTMVDPSGRTTTWSYDAANEVTAVTYSDGKTPNVTNVTYSLDAQRTSMIDGTGTSSWTYDSLNRMTSSTNGTGAKVSYGYDLKGQETSITYPGSTGTVTRAYDAAGELISITDPSGKTTSFGYDPNSDNTSETFPSTTGGVDTYSYNAADQMTGITDTKTGTAFASFSYARDPNGQVTSVTSTGVPADNHSYSYDQLNQLTNVDSSSYSYDNADNLTKLTSGTTQSFDAADQLTSSTNGTFTYDNQGNRTSGPATLGGSATYTYDQADRLTSANVGGNGSAVGLIAGGEYHSVAVTSSGTVWAWGYNAYGQLGNGNTTNTDVPVQVNGITTGTAVAAGDLSSAALLTGGTVKTWGYNGYGQLGNGTTTNSSTPVTVSGLTGVTAIASGNYHMLALEPNGTVMAWGLNNAGQLGDGTTTNRTTPVAVKGLSNITQIAAGGVPGYAGHSVALKSDSTVWTWGYGKQGQLGLGSNTSTVTPTQVPGLSGITQIAANGADTYALKSDGTVWAWGDNAYGQIGNTSAGQTQNTPIKVNIASVTSIGAGGTAAFAIKSDGTTWGWGDDNTGQLGDGAKCGKTCTNPVQVQGFTGATAVTGGYVHTLAAKSDGTVWAWGRNVEGELGDGNTTVSTVPVQASGLSNVKPNPPVKDSYTYNGDGLRMSRTSNGTTTQFSWDNSGSTPMLLSDGTNSYIYGPGGLPIEEITPTGAYYYHHDQLGSTRLLTDSSGNVAATYTYDSYGRTTAKTGSNTNPFGFGSAYTDPATGMFYLINRYYDPATGQFISVDPLESTTHSPYGYVNGSPLNGVDPLGLGCGIFSPVCDAAGAVGGAISSGAQTVGSGLATAGSWVYQNAIAPAYQWVVDHGSTLVDLGAGILCVVGGAESFGTACLPAVAIAAGYATYTKVSQDIANGDSVTQIIEDSLIQIGQAGLMITPAGVEAMAEKVIAEEGVAASEELLQTRNIAGGLDKMLTAYGFYKDLRELLYGGGQCSNG